MLTNIDPTILHDMDNLIETRDRDRSGKRLAAVIDFLERTADHFARQKQLTADPAARHEAATLYEGFAAAGRIVERVREQAPA